MSDSLSDGGMIDATAAVLLACEEDPQVPADVLAEEAVRAYLGASQPLTEDAKECPTCGAYLRGCRDCGAVYDEDGGCGSCLGLLPSRGESLSKEQS